MAISALATALAVQPAVSAAEGLPDLFRRASPSVVVVKTIDANGASKGFGSGVVLSHDGLVATNEHVIRGADGIVLQLASDDA